MNAKDWKSISEVERLSFGLPFPESWYRGEYSDGKDHDGVFIHDQLSRLTLAQRSRAADAYSELYRGVDGRFEQNTRLREFADKCCKSNSGQTISPRRVAQ